MISRRFILAFFTLPALITAFMSTSYVGKVRAGDECSAVIELDKSIDRNRATVKNNSSSCEFVVTLALYDSPQEPETIGWILAQTLIGYDTETVKPGETVDFFVEDKGKTCMRQADLFVGSKVLTPPIYVNNLGTDIFRNEGTCVTPTVINTPTPTPTNTPTPTQTPTPTATSTPTSTPTPEATNTPTPGPTASPTPGPSTTQAVLASTGNTSFIYAVIISGAVSLISGLILRKFGK